MFQRAHQLTRQVQFLHDVQGDQALEIVEQRFTVDVEDLRQAVVAGSGNAFGASFADAFQQGVFVFAEQLFRVVLTLGDTKLANVLFDDEMKTKERRNVSPSAHSLNDC